MQRPSHSLANANDMKATSRNNARSLFLLRRALSNESVPMVGALVRLMQMAGPNEQALTIRKSPPTLFVLSPPPGNPFSPCLLIRLACPSVLSLKPYAFHLPHILCQPGSQREISAKRQCLSKHLKGPLGPPCPERFCIRPPYLKGCLGP